MSSRRNTTVNYTNIENDAENESNKMNDLKLEDKLAEQALTTAIYNTIAIAIFVICIGLLAILLIVLQVFVRSILWAVLTSAFLFSFKRYLTDLSRNRLSFIEKNGATLAIELIISPFRLIDSTIDLIWSFIVQKYRQFLILVSTIILFNLSCSFYETLFDYSIKILSILTQTSNLMTYYVDNSWQFTCALVIAYLLAIAFYWHENYSTIFQILSLPVWLSIMFLSSKLLGQYRPYFMIVFIFLICIGVYSFLYEFFLKLKENFKFKRRASR